jgi:hypothetical protein
MHFFRATVKPLLIVLALTSAVMAVGSVALAAPAAKSVTGTWSLTIKVAGQTVPATAKITQTGTKVTGNITSSLGNAKIAGSVTGQTIVLKFASPVGNVVATGKINATWTAISGTFAVAGQKGTWTAKKK